MKMPTRSKQQKHVIKRFFDSQRKRYVAFMSRRPHRSFRQTRRRDYVRPITLPGNISFTKEVTTTLWHYKKVFLLLAAVYAILFAGLVGIQSQDTYATLSDTLKETGTEVFQGDFSALGQAGLLFVSIASLGATSDATESQQIFSVLIFLMIWLTTVWLLRNLLAGHKVKLRDGLYNAGSPLFAMVIVALFIAVQLIPAAVALIGYNAAATSGLIAAGGAGAMLFWVGAGLLCLLSLFWVTSSLFAMIIVTLPGMYPYKAIRTASDIVLSRRTKLLLRWLWMALVVVVAWAVVLIPIILLDMGVKSLWPAIQWLPIVPVAIVLMAALSSVWSSSYVYLLYRKVVDNA
jgi:hypothetical protein